MHSHVQERREAINSSADDNTAKDIFSLFVRASEDEGGKMGLSNEELVPISNCSKVAVLNNCRSGMSLRCSLLAMVRFRPVYHSGVLSNSLQRPPHIPWQPLWVSYH